MGEMGCNWQSIVQGGPVSDTASSPKLHSAGCGPHNNEKKRKQETRGLIEV